MRCEEFEIRLDELLDDRSRPSADTALAAHASQCATCERLLRDYESLLDGLSAMPLPSVPAGLPLRVVADWRAVPRTGAPRRKALAALALAATLLVAAIPAFAWLMRSPTLQKDNAAPAVVIAGSATDRGTPAADGHREPVDETRVALVDQVRETYEPLVAATNESLAGVWNALPGANGSDHTASPRADESATLDDAVLDEDLAASIRPVATSATRSVAALLRVLPGSSRALDERGIAQ